MLTPSMPINGWTCGGIMSTVRSVLSTRTGAREMRVNVGTASPTFDPASTTPKAIRAAIACAGHAAAAD